MKDKEKEKVDFMKNVGTFLQGNTLIDSLEGESDMPENLLVVAFYLVTRESGLFF